MEPADLRRRAREEADELGSEPVNPAERALWREERWGAVVLLAGLADDDPALLRRAAIEVAGELADGGYGRCWSTPRRSRAPISTKTR